MKIYGYRREEILIVENAARCKFGENIQWLNETFIG
jgi:hypothetical protein